MLFSYFVSWESLLPDLLTNALTYWALSVGCAKMVPQIPSLPLAWWETSLLLYTLWRRCYQNFPTISGAGDIQSQTFSTLLGSRTLAFGVLLFNSLMVADVFTSEDVGLKLTSVSMCQAICPQTCE